ncbi:MAG TPA: hypothetical protein VMT73_03525 [Anaerolineales bacterium]|nr:hypothetical protein [Anaerolineales bacterium]
MNERALIVLLVTVGLILLVNAAMFAIARGAARGDHRWINAIRDSLYKPLEKSNQPYHELRQRMKELSDRSSETKKQTEDKQ